VADAFDRSHVLAVTCTYMLPVRCFANPLARGFLHAWEISGINTALRPCPAHHAGNTSVARRRADYLGGPVPVESDLRGPNNYINRAAFAVAPDERRGNGDAGIVRAPRLLWDASLRKQFRFGDHGKYRIQFQADGVNRINRANFGSPTTDLSNAAFGTVATPVRRATCNSV
jgi:hypothetical protein